RDGKSRTDFSIGQCAAQSNEAAGKPGYKKQRRRQCCICSIRRCPEDAHSNHKAYHDHGKIEQAEFWFLCHGLKIGEKEFGVWSWVFVVYFSDIVTSLRSCHPEAPAEGPMV